MTALARQAPRLILGSGVVLLCIVVWYLTLAPATIGGPLSLVLVRGTSMEPTYVNGDLVIGYRSARLTPGDVVVFRGPGGSPVIHRLMAFDGDRLVTRGDNLTVDDPWPTGTEDVLGTARLRIAGAGAIFRSFGRPPVLGGLAALLVLSFILWRGEVRDSHALATVGIAMMVVATPFVVGRAASINVVTGELTALTVAGPFDTYLITPGGGGGGGNPGGSGGGSGGGNGGGNGRP